MLKRTVVMGLKELTYIARSKNIITPPRRKKPPVHLLIISFFVGCRRIERTYPQNRKLPQFLHIVKYRSASYTSNSRFILIVLRRRTLGICKPHSRHFE